MRFVYVIGRNHEETDFWMWNNNERFKGGVEVVAINRIEQVRSLQAPLVVKLEGAELRRDWDDFERLFKERRVRWLSP